MNLFPTPTESPTATADWTMKFTIHDSGMTCQCTAVVMRQEKPMCNISMTSDGLDHDRAHMQLAEKARAWIAEYQARRSDAS